LIRSRGCGAAVVSAALKPPYISANWETKMTIAADATLDEIRAALAPLIAANAAFDGWTAEARDFAADQAGLDRDIARLAFEGGAVAMIDAWFASIDAAMHAAFTPEELAAM